MTIDTDKYEGHSPAPWKWRSNHIFCTTEYKEEEKLAAIAQWISTRSQDAKLMADAPLLLAEVKRLRKQVVALLHENERLEAMYHMDVHGDDTLAKLLERKK